MAEFSMSDYQIFGQAIETGKVLNSKLQDEEAAIKECQEVLGSESIFMGPIADNCKDSSTKCISKLTQSQENYTTIGTYLQSTSDKYQAGDKEAENYLLSVENGKVTSGKASSISYNGNTIYYNQKGYFKDGVLHEWPTKWTKTISFSGCGPTSMAACLANMLGDPSITPSTIANLMKHADNIGGRFVGKAAKKFGIQQTCKYGLSPERMNKCLRNGGTMIVAVKEGGHYIAVVGINDKTNPPTYIVNDPNDAKASKKYWTYKAISQGHTMTFYLAPKGKTLADVT